jgi:uncharacterized membrane protein
MTWRSYDLAPARLRLTGCAVLGVLVGVGAGFFWVGVGPALLLGWDGAALGYVIWALLGTARLDPDATLRRAVAEDPGRAAFDLLLLASGVASLFGVGLVIMSTGTTSRERDLSALLAVGTVVAGWSLVHTVFAERYARLYYHDEVGGIDFHDPLPPSYLDFMYLAFTVGMTFQVSDTEIGDKTIRATVFRHALLSYLFGTVIIAATINLLVGLAR